MKTQNEILQSIDPEISTRIHAILRLFRQQARGAELLRKGVKTYLKPDSSPVTVADLLHQSQLQAMISERFPGDGLICEEPRSLQEEALEDTTRLSKEVYGIDLKPEVISIPESGRITWVLDPIDGTKGYLAGRYYALAVAFFVDGKPAFGAMAVPSCPVDNKLEISRSLAFALPGKGAWMALIKNFDSLEASREQRFKRLNALREPIEEPYRIAVSLEHAGVLKEKLEAMEEVSIVRFDSQAKYLAVGSGELDAYLRLRRNDGYPDVIWDHMPGGIIASEAGCVVRHINGEKLEFSQQENMDFKGGMVCCRGEAGGVLDRLIEGLFTE
jgi:3'(2'), 5'-bisphosphate nucleotidase